jgi:uncharacterized membrane protein
MTALFGTGLACVALVVAALADWDGSYGPYLVAAGVIYVVGSDGVTMVFNVPRNNQVARAAPDSPDGAEVWKRYLREWTAWNTVRTVASLAALVLLMAALAAA